MLSSCEEPQLVSKTSSSEKVPRTGVHRRNKLTRMSKTSGAEQALAHGVLRCNKLNSSKENLWLR